jgi:hypothetical protein
MARKPKPQREVIAKAERRLAKAVKQRGRIKADPKREVAREQRRVDRAKPGAIWRDGS